MKAKTGRGAKKSIRPDEVFTYGPLRAARFGRTVVMKSAWDPKEYRRFRDSFPLIRAEREAQLKKHIAEVVSLIRKYDAFELLAGLFVKNSVVDPTEYEESSATGKEHFAEYTFSILAATPESDLRFEHVDETVVEKFETALEAVFDDALALILFEPENASNDGLEEFRFQMLVRHLIMRGDSYPEHHLDLFRRLAAPHDDYLRSTYHFSSDELLATFQAIEKQVMERLQRFGEWFDAVRRARDLAFENLDKKGVNIEEATSEDEARRQLREAIPEELLKRIEETHQGLHESGRELLAVDLSDHEISRAVVEACSCQPGENLAFVGEPFAGRPDKATLIWTRPLLHMADGYYCPSPVVLFRSTFEVLEALLLRDPANKERYQKARSRALESMAVDLLRNVLPGATVGTRLFYTTRDGERAETDAILVYDRHVFVVEAKAGALTLPARRGAPKRLKRDFAKIIEDAFAQGVRVRDHVLNQDEARFDDAEGKQNLTLKRADVDGLYIINPTMAAMDPLGVQLGLAREKGLLSGDLTWPWCIFINDLRIVSELIDSPAEFILFLQRRLAANSLPYAAADELDLFCKFLADGLFHEEGDLKGVDRVKVSGFTDPLDHWYIGRPHGREVDKPGRKVPLEVRALTHALEGTQRAFRTAAAIRIIELDQKGLDQIQAFLDRFRRTCAEDGREHDLTLQFQRPFSRGISLYVTKDGRLSSQASNHAAMRKRLARATEWLAIAVSAADAHVDFTFLGDHELAPRMENRVEQIRRDSLARFVAANGRRPGRNEQCPCTSGRKFKKCCALLPEIG